MFWDALPQYMAVGMTSEEFWHGDLRLCKSYRDCARLKSDMEDMRQWKAGVYAYHALVAAANAYREWSPGPEHPYPESPLFGSPESRERAERLAQQREMEKCKAFVETFAAQFNASIEANQSEE